MDKRRDIRTPTAGIGLAEVAKPLPISASERDFWRRAVAAERARLSLGGPPPPPAPELH